MSKEGFSGLQQSLNPNYGTLNSNLNVNKDALEKFIITGRVLDIILDNQHPKFEELGEWSSIGTIEFVNVDNNGDIIKGSSKTYAKPIFPNFRNYPIFNEIVYLIQLPNQEVMENGGVKQFYYLNPINVWNHPHHNAVPFFLNNKQNTNKSYQTTTLGNVNQTNIKQNKIDFGPGFVEISNLHPLIYYLGDYILEGRWGNSIRFGSTVKSNIWSKEGNNGDPITIIRNGQPVSSSKEGWLPILEDINNDLSSIYLTSNQVIPIKVSSKKYDSYITNPTETDKFQGNQIIISSGRLIFNSIKDHILLTSAKSVGLNSLESVNIDTKNFNVVSSITRLGDNKTTNPMLKGNETLKALNVVIDNIIKIAEQLSTLAEILPSVPNVAINIAASEAVSELNNLKGSLTNDITSKSNFLI